MLVWQSLQWLACDVFLFWVLPEGSRRLVLAPLIGAQLATLAGWYALGEGSVLVRLPIALIAIAIAEPTYQLLTGELGLSGDLTAAVTGYLLGIATPLLGLRIFGWSCRLPKQEPEPPAPGGARRPFQFWIWHVLLATLLIGAALGLLRIVPERNLNTAFAAAAYALATGALPWSLWIVLLRPHPYQGLPVVLAILVVAWVVGSWLEGGRLTDTLYWIGMTMLYTLVLGINLLLLRRQGYRLARR
jgi:hypothetical protein